MAILNRDSTPSSSRLPTNSVTVNGLSLQNCTARTTLLNLNSKNLFIEFSDLTLKDNVGSKLGPVYISGSSSITFTNSVFENNLGLEHGDVFIES